MAGRRGLAHEDLRHFGGGMTAGKDMRVTGDDASGIRPSVRRMLFSGGSADRQLAKDETTRGHSEHVRPRTAQPLYRGGETASEDLRTGHDAGLEPDDEEMLSEGGEVKTSESLIIAAEDLMDLLQGGAFYGDRINDNDSKIEKASKEASRRAKAEILAKSLKAFFMLCESEPHDEG